MAKEINDRETKQKEWLNRYINQVTKEFNETRANVENNRSEVELERQKKLAEIVSEIQNIQGEKSTESYLKILQTEVAERSVGANSTGAVGAKAEINQAVTRIHRLDANAGRDWGAIARGKRQKQLGADAQSYAENDDLYQAGNINKAA